MSKRTIGTPVWILRLMLVAVALAIGLTAVEVALRVAGVHRPRTGQRHDFRGTAYRPHVEWVQSGEGYAHIRTNSEGFRDDEWTVAKPAETVRIAVLGDSYVDALQVEEPNRFTERLVDALSACRSVDTTSLEVMNFGQSGYGTAQELLTFRHNVTKYSPDLVILAFLPHNDLRNNSPTLQGDTGRPYFVLDNDALVFDDSFRETRFHRQPWWKRLANFGRDHVRVMELAHNTRRRILRRAEGRRRAPAV